MSWRTGRLKWSSFGWASVTLGCFWERAGTAHTIEWAISKVQAHLDLPPVLLVVFGLAWVVYFEKRPKTPSDMVPEVERAAAKPFRSSTPSTLPDQVDEVVCRERITTVDREFRYRRGS